MKQLKYITKCHIAMHTILLLFKDSFILQFLSGVIVLNDIILLIT